jgi:hypothetical protein
MGKVRLPFEEPVLVALRRLASGARSHGVRFERGHGQGRRRCHWRTAPVVAGALAFTPDTATVVPISQPAGTHCLLVPGKTQLLALDGG